MAAKKNTLRLTRDQLAVVAHNDPETIRQFELLVAAVVEASAPSSSPVAADTSLASGDVTMSVALNPGSYVVSALVMLDAGAAASIATEASAALVLSSGFLLVSSGNNLGTLSSEQKPAVGVVAAVAKSSTAIVGAVNVTKAGTMSVRVSGSGTIRAGSYLSIKRLT